MSLRTLPPAGTRLKFSDYRGWLANLLHQPSGQLLKNWLKEYDSGTPFLVSSGGTALMTVLRAMAMCRPGRNEVVVPSYTCYSVPACVVRAGLKIRVADLDPDTLSIDPIALARMDLSNVLAIMGTNLYGFPDDVVALSGVANDCGAYFIDDAAQSIGATVAGKHSGSFGSAGIYSFDKGKAITSYQGGAITSRDDELTEVLKNLYASLPTPSRTDTFVHCAVLAAYGAFLNPYLYSIPARIPFLQLGKTIYSEDFSATRYSDVLAAFTLVLTDRFQDIVNSRRSTGIQLQESLAAHSHIAVVRPVADTHPSYLRLPLLVSGNGRRQLIKDALERKGLGVSISYPGSIGELAELQNHVVNPGPHAIGQQIANSILTLPTHGFVKHSDLRQIGTAISAIQ